METKLILAQLKTLRTEIDALLSGISDRIEEFDGLSIKLGNCKYRPDGSFTFKVEGTLAGGTSREASDYEHLRVVEAIPTGKPGDSWYSPGIKLPPVGTLLITDYGQRRMVVTGARLRAKYNVIVTIEGTDKRTCYKAADIARIWAAQQEKAHA